MNGVSLLGNGDLAVSGGSSVNVVQATGTSETDVMSQKAVTDVVNTSKVFNYNNHKISFFPYAIKELVS